MKKSTKIVKLHLTRETLAKMVTGGDQDNGADQVAGTEFYCIWTKTSCHQTC